MTFQEPPLQDDDTQPRRATSRISETPPTGAPTPPVDPSWTAPLDTDNLLDADAQQYRSRTPCLISTAVMVLTTCMCAAIVLMAAVAGYRDELDDIQTEEAANLQGTSAVQYELALADIAAGNLEIAFERLRFIDERLPAYQNTSGLLQEVALQLSVTPTPSATHTPSMTPTPQATSTPDASPTPTLSPVEVAFQQGQAAHISRRWEDAIEMLEIVRDLNPSYRRQEVAQMLFDAYDQQARIYFNGGNPVEQSSAMGLPGNQLARGLQLYQKALALLQEAPAAGRADELDNYTAGFVDRFLNAQRLVDAGNNAAALPILEQLCSENCDWGYRGLTVRGLLDQARAG
jgi:tetratricopeptide (TPR) repeat protein